jgi:HlyD family secretion protein
MNPPAAARSPRMTPARATFAGVALVLLAAGAAVSGCSKSGAGGWQGYLEGEYVYVASPLSGRLEKLLVAKGSRVAAGAPLFELEHAAESAALREAGQQAQAAKAQLEDLKKGSRPEEIAALEARLGQARAQAELSRLELVRQEALFKAAAITASDFDRARLTHEADARTVDEEQAKLDTARLGGRPDAIAAATAAMRAAADARIHARWSVDQKAQAAPAPGLVFDTLYREGEFVSAGSPVVALLPPANIKVRFFVPEPELARIKGGEHVAVRVEGLPAPLDGVVSYISPQPEYTPPVLYNQDNRAKLVYMLEAVFPQSAAADLHPGQPVYVEAPAR